MNHTDELQSAIAYAETYSGASDLSPEYAAVYLFRIVNDLKQNIEAANRLLDALKRIDELEA